MEMIAYVLLSCPSDYTLSVICERLGYNPQINLLRYLNKDMVKIQEKMDELDSCISYGQIQEADAIIEELEKNKDFTKNKFNQQYLLLSKGANGVNKDEDTEILFSTCLEAIHLIFSKFEISRIRNYTLSSQDLQVFGLLGIIHGLKGDYVKAIDVYEQLIENMDNRYMDKWEKGRHYPLITFNLANTLTESNQYEEAIKRCNQGIEIAKSTGELFYLPFLAMVKVASLTEIGEINKAERLIKEVYFTQSLLGNHIQKDFALDFARRRLGIDLETN